MYLVIIFNNYINLICSYQKWFKLRTQPCGDTSINGLSLFTGYSFSYHFNTLSILVISHGKEERFQDLLITILRFKNISLVEHGEISFCLPQLLHGNKILIMSCMPNILEGLWRSIEKNEIPFRNFQSSLV